MLIYFSRNYDFDTSQNKQNKAKFIVMKWKNKSSVLKVSKKSKLNKNKLLNQYYEILQYKILLCFVKIENHSVNHDSIE
ncbi:hypothetical protein BpHYR1_020126 [Brachionus plicatilis]|uniref:Uncharacterized protein n=1 Tax=Brachionus plicatilis TaxID=10195 RepID=A0A3M7RXK3_BRAPC|nr:hypothetical protein BpHYR1_020126 [Brachionus plicatilis]